MHYIKRYSAQLMFCASILGFLLPEYSSAVFEVLPIVLFLLMLVTLLGINQKKLWRALISKTIWAYGLVHSVLLTFVICGSALLLGASEDLLLAISAVTATGSLFATPAIVKSLGFDPLEAMAMTISSTLLMPIVLFFNLTLFQSNEFSLDIVTYLLRLAIFIAGPIILTYFSVLVFGEKRLISFQERIVPFSLFLVFAFPFGLIGSFSSLIRTSPEHGLFLFSCAVFLILASFCIGFITFIYRGKEKALISAITLGNRNLLLTYAIAGPYLGSEYLPLIGALQLPMFALPWVTKTLLNQKKLNTAPA
ncbi:MAG: hypothetical protein GY820_41090 [Gammaproteobacteria bacterium]|nr:hypothetical protein [Gammaproteobacteria bacterium]